MYLPKSKYTSDLYTSGGEYVYASNKRPYSGFYFKTYDERYFTGKSPSNTSEELIIAPDDVSPTKGSPSRQFTATTRYDLIRNNAKEFNLKSTLPVDIFYPQPTQADYTRGYITRYFVKEKSTDTIKEISKEIYEALKRKDTTYYYPDYTPVKFPWIISGALSDKIVSGYKVPGASSLNNKTLLEVEKKIPGILQYLPDLTQFA